MVTVEEIQKLKELKSLQSQIDSLPQKELELQKQIEDRNNEAKLETLEARLEDITGEYITLKGKIEQDKFPIIQHINSLLSHIDMITNVHSKAVSLAQHTAKTRYELGKSFWKNSSKDYNLIKVDLGHEVSIILSQYSIDNSLKDLQILTNSLTVLRDQLK